MKWFRFYSEALDDPKVQRLTPTLFRFWVNLLCVANENGERGSLPSLTDIAFRLRISEERAVMGVDELTARGLIDRISDGLSMHNWDQWQFESDDAAERMRQLRRTRSEQVPHPLAPRTEQNRADNRPDQTRRGNKRISPDVDRMKKKYDEVKA